MGNSLLKSATTFSLLLLLITNLTAKDVLKMGKEPSGINFKSNWQKSFGGDEKDKAHDVIALKDGGFLVAGESKSYGIGRKDMLIAKFDKSGKFLYRSSFGEKKDDVANAVTTTSDGAFMAVGYTTSYSKYGDKDLYVVKFSKDGKSIWKKYFGGERNDVGYDIVGVGGGKAIIVGYTESYGKGYKDIYLLYIDIDGKEIWSKAIGGEDDEMGYSIALAKDGFYVAGTTRSKGAGGFDFYLLKFNNKAKLQYSKVFGGINDDIFKSAVATKDGGCVVAGKTKSFGAKHFDVDVIKYDAKGKMLWHKLFGFKSQEWADDIIELDNGNLVVVGTTKTIGHGNYDFYVLELEPNGSIRWSKTYGGSDKDFATAIAQLRDKSIIVAGSTLSFGKGDFDFMLVDLQKR